MEGVLDNWAQLEYQGNHHIEDRHRKAFHVFSVFWEPAVSPGTASLHSEALLVLFSSVTSGRHEMWP